MRTDRNDLPLVEEIAAYWTPNNKIKLLHPPIHECSLNIYDRLKRKREVFGSRIISKDYSAGWNFYSREDALMRIRKIKESSEEKAFIAMDKAATISARYDLLEQAILGGR